MTKFYVSFPSVVISQVFWMKCMPWWWGVITYRTYQMPCNKRPDVLSHNLTLQSSPRKMIFDLGGIGLLEFCVKLLLRAYSQVAMGVLTSSLIHSQAKEKRTYINDSFPATMPYQIPLCSHQVSSVRWGS